MLNKTDGRRPRNRIFKSAAQRLSDVFEPVRAVGLALPGVAAATRYDGAPLLKVGGVFLAGLAMHPSAEPGTLVVRTELEDRDRLIEDAPETYYVTEYHRRHPVVLVRLARIDRDALRDLLSVSYRMAVAKTRRTRRQPTYRSP
jgi:hypothetical protein